MKEKVDELVDMLMTDYSVVVSNALKLACVYAHDAGVCRDLPCFKEECLKKGGDDAVFCMASNLIRQAVKEMGEEEKAN